MWYLLLRISALFFIYIKWTLIQKVSRSICFFIEGNLSEINHHIKTRPVRKFYVSGAYILGIIKARHLSYM